MEEESKDEKGFRDRITTVDETGKRKWLFPKKPKGKYYTWRLIIGFLMLSFLFAGPWIKIGGEPLLLLNILERKFVIFGQIFWPQDLYLFVIIMVTGVVAIILFTVVYGRLFCGWVCPQPVFMELVFRRIEFWIDGDFKQAENLDKGPWNFTKIWKRTLKYSIFYLFSLAISHTFLAYIIGADELIKIQTEPLSEHMGGFISILAFAFIFFLVFSWFREQVCLIVCPYGRLQGVMLDRDSIVISYDHVRGENRSKLRKGEDRKAEGKGDCIECMQCVQVCPTGIDIRNGTQLECINCTACIDACDKMMDTVGMEKGLIRYASENSINSGRKSKLTLKAKAYLVLLVALLGLIVFLFTIRGEVEAVILKTPGMTYQERNEGELITNLYNVKLLNKTNDQVECTLKLESPEGKIEMIGISTLTVDKGDKKEGAFFVVIPRSQLSQKSTPIEIGLYAEGEKISLIKTNFIGPEQ